MKPSEHLIIQCVPYQSLGYKYLFVFFITYDSIARVDTTYSSFWTNEKLPIRSHKLAIRCDCYRYDVVCNAYTEKRVLELSNNAIFINYNSTKNQSLRWDTIANFFTNSFNCESLKSYQKKLSWTIINESYSLYEGATNLMDILYKISRKMNSSLNNCLTGKTHSETLLNHDALLMENSFKIHRLNQINKEMSAFLESKMPSLQQVILKQYRKTNGI
jgi:hypothetical protein